MAGATCNAQRNCSCHPARARAVQNLCGAPALPARSFKSKNAAPVNKPGGVAQPRLHSTARKIILPLAGNTGPA